MAWWQTLIVSLAGGAVSLLAAALTLAFRSQRQQIGDYRSAWADQREATRLEAAARRSAEARADALAAQLLEQARRRRSPGTSSGPRS